jgi:predicted 3-demethylubiquinone-9 3-methyltransferase (glyoxalase superfamily)
MQKIIPHLWFDKEAEDAAKFYTSIFDDSKINFITVINDTPSGDAALVGVRIMGFEFMAISAGPFFRINPSISFHVRCATVAEVDQIWKKLSAGGKILMELGQYPFSKRYGWIQDTFGVSWQVIHTEGDFTQRIVPAMMFTGNNAGKAEEAMGYYASVFGNASSKVLARYAHGEAPDREGTVKYGVFTLNGQEFGAMDSERSHDFAFNEAVSFIVNCKDQNEIDYFWARLSAVPRAEQCGWVKDSFNVSWQIIPANMGELVGRNPKKVTPVMLSMKKIIIADLEKAGAQA